MQHNLEEKQKTLSLEPAYFPTSLMQTSTLIWLMVANSLLARVAKEMLAVLP
jgi:hypothetical protein